MSLLISKVDLHLQRPTAVDALIPGGRAQAFGRYELLDTIGRGGCGVVYRAVDLHQGGEVALKVHTTQPGGSGDATNRLRRRFQREAYSLSSVEHENLAQIRGHGSERGLDYLAMELVPGETLEAYVEREGPLGEPALRALLERLARALSAIHARGLVHRDLKPANIVLREGRPADPVLVDFGLAKLVYDRSLTLDGERYGTPAFMAPEQVIGEDASSQTDLFSLGLVACYAASGQCAFPSLDLSALLRARCSRPSQVPAGLSPGLRSALSRLTKIRSSRRTSTANDLLRELAGLPSVGLAELAGR
ncbi:MAG: serine/threonine protein kinase [Planctomycetes bacterium]|nr:serine/threonine protein kinase [Planctomycetota bacterium]